MAMLEFLQSINDEVKSLLDSKFAVSITSTQVVPNVEDQGFNLGTGELLRGKTLNTCVLFIDIRKSTQINLKFKDQPETLARLYASFIKSMLRAAEYYGGKVRNINGDRVMVVFDTNGAFLQAVRTATLMNTICDSIINKYFTQDLFQCGIGIDYGPMLVVKTGTVKQGAENQFYKSFVWLGKPANMASKLTDLANKVSDKKSIVLKYLGFNFPSLFPTFSFLSSQPVKKEVTYTTREIELSLEDFASSIEKEMDEKAVTYKAQKIFSWKKKEVKITTPPILITEEVYKGLIVEDKSEHLVKFFAEVNSVSIDGYTGKVYGSKVIFTDIAKVK